MDENNIIRIISDKIGNKYIGDDCAYLKDLNIVVTQDSLIENIHFKREWYTAFQLGYKAISVNISDILASGAEPKYITVALSLPANINNKFIEEFYDGINSGLYGAKVIGGDITGSKNDIAISIAAIGSTINRNISSRSYAKPSYKIITKGLHGTSAAGLNELLSGGSNQELIQAHLSPKLEYEFSKEISTSTKCEYAMMDTSDGIADALFKIAESSKVSIEVDYNKIPHLNNIDEKLVLFGGEDYKLVAAVPESSIKYITNAVIIGEVKQYNGTRLKISDYTYNEYEELDVFNHFAK